MTTPSADDEGQSRWRLDRTVSPALIVAVIGGLCTIAGFGYTLTSDVQDTKRELARMKLQVEDGDRRLSDRSDERYRGILVRMEVVERDRDRLARVEEKVSAVADLLREIRQEMRPGRR